MSFLRLLKKNFNFLTHILISSCFWGSFDIIFNAFVKAKTIEFNSINNLYIYHQSIDVFIFSFLLSSNCSIKSKSAAFNLFNNCLLLIKSIFHSSEIPYFNNSNDNLSKRPSSSDKLRVRPNCCSLSLKQLSFKVQVSDIWDWISGERSKKSIEFNCSIVLFSNRLSDAFTLITLHSY